MADPAPPSPAARKGSLRNILLNTGWMLGGKGFGAVLSLVYLAIVTRSLGIAGFGIFSLVLGTAQGVVALMSFQSWQIVVRYGMDHLHADRTIAVARLIQFTAWLDLASAVIGAAFVALGIALLGAHFGWDAEFRRQVTIICILFTLSVHQTPMGILRLHDRFGTATVADAVTPLLRCIGAIIVWLIHPSVTGFMIVWTVAEVATAIAYWFAALREGGWRLPGPLRWADIAADNPGIGRFALLTNASSSLTTGASQLIVLLVGLLLSPAAAGAFRFAQQLANSLAKLSQLMARAIFPELMRTRAGSADPHDFRRLFRRTMRIASAGGATVIVLLLVAGYPLLGLIAGPEFLSAYPILLLLGIAAAVDFVGVGLEPALVALGRPGLVLWLKGIATLWLFAALWAMTVLIGVNGTGLAFLTASVISFGLMTLAVRRAAAT